MPSVANAFASQPFLLVFTYFDITSPGSSSSTKSAGLPPPSSLLFGSQPVATATSRSLTLEVGRF